MSGAAQRAAPSRLPGSAAKVSSVDVRNAVQHLHIIYRLYGKCVLQCTVGKCAKPSALLYTKLNCELESESTVRDKTATLPVLKCMQSIYKYA